MPLTTRLGDITVSSVIVTCFGTTIKTIVRVGGKMCEFSGQRERFPRWWYPSRQPQLNQFLTPLLRDSSHPYRLVNERTGRVLAEHLIAAFDSTTRRKGLLARDTFPRGSAMIIAPTNAIHTFFMKFAIDVLFVAKDGRIVKLRRALPPWRIAAAWRAQSVIELAGGVLEEAGVEPGDRLALLRLEQPPT